MNRRSLGLNRKRLRGFHHVLAVVARLGRLSGYAAWKKHLPPAKQAALNIAASWDEPGRDAAPREGPRSRASELLHRSGDEGIASGLPGMHYRSINGGRE